MSCSSQCQPSLCHLQEKGLLVLYTTSGCKMIQLNCFKLGDAKLWNSRCESVDFSGRGDQHVECHTLTGQQESCYLPCTKFSADVLPRYQFPLASWLGCCLSLPVNQPHEEGTDTDCHSEKNKIKRFKYIKYIWNWKSTAGVCLV